MVALASRQHLYLFSLNGHPIASTTPEGDVFADFTFGLPETPTPRADDWFMEFTGGITFLRRDFLKFGPLFVVGINNELALYRCVPGERRFEDEDVKPWKIVEQGRLSRSGDHPYGECCIVKFMGWVLSLPLYRKEQKGGWLMDSETLYAAFEPRQGGNKWALYQWSLPEGDARHVSESTTSVCMATGCGRHFGLLGGFLISTWGDFGTDSRTQTALWRMWRIILRDTCRSCRNVQFQILRIVSSSII